MLAPQQMESVFLRPSNVASRRFSRTTGGYDPDEVHQFLEDVADYLSRLEGELEWRRALRTRQSGTFAQQSEAINVVTAAREQAERILADARKEAEGYMRLARAIAHQLALEAQARRPQVAFAVTRASGSSETVEGFAGFEDMEVWVDDSVFDLTKVEKPESSGDAVVSPDAAATDAASSDDTANPPDVAASDETSNPPEVVTTAEGEPIETESSTSTEVSTGVPASTEAPSSEETQASVADVASNAATSGKRKRKSRKKF